MDALSACPHGPGTGHDTALAHELRALALVALDRVEPLLDRLRDAVADGSAADGAVCPVCATLAAVRAERPELAGRLAAHAAELAAALRETLTDRGPAAPDPAAASAAAGTARPVQRIRVERIRVERGPAGCDRSGHDASDQGGTSC